MLAFWLCRRGAGQGGRMVYVPGGGHGVAAESPPAQNCRGNSWEHSSELRDLVLVRCWAWGSSSEGLGGH